MNIHLSESHFKTIIKNLKLTHFVKHDFRKLAKKVNDVIEFAKNAILLMEYIGMGYTFPHAFLLIHN
jgi:hypothetical protein